MSDKDNIIPVRQGFSRAYWGHFAGGLAFPSTDLSPISIKTRMEAAREGRRSRQRCSSMRWTSSADIGMAIRSGSGG